MVLNIEWFPVVNEAGEVVGKATRQECHNGSKLLHPVIHLHILNQDNLLYLQKRSFSKDIQPGKWDTAVGGHIDYGESVEQALFREASEELGISEFSFNFITQYLFESTIEKELVYSFITMYERTITPDGKELSDGKFWKIGDIQKNMGKHIFTPNFEHEFTQILLPYLADKSVII